MTKFQDLLKPIQHADGRATALQHPQRPYTNEDAEIAGRSHRALAKKYLMEVRSKLGLTKSILAAANEPFRSSIAPEASMLRFSASKTIGNTRVNIYQHSYLGLPVWREGINVLMFADRPSIIGSSSTVAAGIRLPYLELDEDNLAGPQNEKKLSALQAAISDAEQEMPALVGSLADVYGSESAELLTQHPVIFRYESGSRGDRDRVAPAPQDHWDADVRFRLDEAPPAIESGSYRVCIEVFFSLDTPNLGFVSWRALVDVATRDVLYLRANVHSVDGDVFPLDAERLTGDATLTPGSSAADLDPHSVSVPLLGLTAPAMGSPQDLDGEFVVIQDDLAPNVDPPTEPVGTDFSDSATTDEFAAVNAYYHMDSLYRMVDDFGLDAATYFGGTTFPIPVDHRGLGGAENAFHSGTDAFGRTDRFAFGLLSGGSVGYATLRAACAHEFAHSCLQNSINDGVFSWCHGFGDALGVVLCDPGSLAADRFVRSPFMTSGAGLRRHDRDVAAGFAWGGTKDASGAQERRQIMSTTMFRAYRSTGGDSVHGDPAVQLDRRSFASRYMAFLMLGAVGSMNPTTPPASVVDFETALISFDKTNPDFEGHPGGAFHKVIRWAFEKQGLHKLAGDPADGEGAPPPVDVYIDDGRDGEYEFQSNFWNTTDIWSAQVNDSTVGHQTPLVGVTNYFFVRIKNRGQQTAENVVVKAYHCRPGTGLVWPVDWTPMDTPEVAVGTLAAGTDTVVGPFEWTPTNVGHECLLASVSADDDESNADTVLGNIPHWRLVPFDNNIAQRNVSPEEPDADGLATSLTDRSFWVNNPYDRAVTVILEAQLPAFLQERDWRILFSGVAGDRLTLPPRGSRNVTFTLEAGAPFQRSDVPRDGANIDIETTIDNHVVGGMTYFVDPALDHRLPELPTEPERCVPGGRCFKRWDVGGSRAKWMKLCCGAIGFAFLAGYLIGRYFRSAARAVR
ncbi:MAG: hypothetical protein O6951_04215 [Actinobacteria bacterium]|nr:hypothetical protein [Actinomycetota bacterium]